VQKTVLTHLVVVYVRPVKVDDLGTFRFEQDGNFQTDATVCRFLYRGDATLSIALSVSLTLSVERKIEYMTIGCFVALSLSVSICRLPYQSVGCSTIGCFVTLDQET
jgi:hypothetical protein